jgi:hypothetical protein
VIFKGMNGCPRSISVAFHWEFKILKSSLIALSISYGSLTAMLILLPVFYKKVV